MGEVRSLIPLVSCIAKTEFSFGLMKFKIVFLNLFSDTIYCEFPHLNYSISLGNIGKKMFRSF